MNNRVIRNVKLFCVFWIVLGVLGIIQNGLIEFNEENLAGSLLVIVLFGALFLFMNKPKKLFQEPEEFLVAIVENKEAILNNGWNYHELIINEQTELVQYFLTVSYIFGSIKVPTRFYIVDKEDSSSIRKMCSIFTLFLGWWGIPMGPIYTIKSISTNLKGGYKVKVKDLLVLNDGI